MNLILFILMIYGISYIITSSEIFSKIREKIKNKFLNKLLICQTCTSFWVGLGIHFLFPITIFPLISAIIGMAAIDIIQKIIIKIW